MLGSHNNIDNIQSSLNATNFWVIFNITIIKLKDEFYQSFKNILFILVPSFLDIINMTKLGEEDVSQENRNYN